MSALAMHVVLMFITFAYVVQQLGGLPPDDEDDYDDEE